MILGCYFGSMIKKTAVLSPMFKTWCQVIVSFEKLEPEGTFTSRVPVVSVILNRLPDSV